MAKRLLEVDPVTGISTFHDYDHQSKKTYITHSQDLTNILGQNQALRNNADYKKGGIKNDWYHFATVPMVVVMELKTKHNLDVFNDNDLPAIERLLKDRDYTKLRTVDRI